LEKDWFLVSRFCGSKLPAPFITNPNQKQLKFTFFSDNVNYAQGFQFNYDYVRLPECVYNLRTTPNKTGGQIIISNNIRAVYHCDWYITTEPGLTILLNIQNEYLEDYKQNQFVIRIFELADLNNEYLVSSSLESNEPMISSPRYTYHLDPMAKNFEVNSSRIRIQLVVGKNMMMDKGQLKINWVAASNNICKQNQYMCQRDGYCIQRELYCDKIPHCLDGSDEKPDCKRIFSVF